MLFATLLNKRWRGAIRIVPIPVPFLEFLKPYSTVVQLHRGNERAFRVKSEGA